MTQSGIENPAGPMTARLSIVIPALNEAMGIVATLESLGDLRRRGHEVIVADGGSSDATAALAEKLADRVVCAAAGRAEQMNAGARAAAGDVLLFLHADSRLPGEAERLVLQGLAKCGSAWGRFDVRIAGTHPLLRLVERMMNLRSRLTHICTGDQAIFVRRDVYQMLGGYAPLPLMEDIELSTRLKWIGRPACLPGPVLASSRRWEKRGIIRTILVMWTLRFLYWLGVSPARLARWYYPSL